MLRHQAVRLDALKLETHLAAGCRLSTSPAPKAVSLIYRNEGVTGLLLPFAVPIMTAVTAAAVVVVAVAAGSADFCCIVPFAVTPQLRLSEGHLRPLIWRPSFAHWVPSSLVPLGSFRIVYCVM